MDSQEGAVPSAAPKKKRTSKAIVPVLDPVQVARRLAEGASMVDAVARDIEQEDGVLEQRVVDRFRAMELAHRDQCDVALAALNELRGRINKALAMEAIFKDGARKMKRALEAAEETISAVVREHPDIPYAGDTGGFKILKDGGKEPLKLDDRLDALKRTVHVGNVISAEVAFEFDLPPEYIERVEFYKLRTDLIRADIDAGKTLAFAWIGERGSRLGYNAVKIGLQDINQMPLPEEPAQIEEGGES